MNKQGGLMSKCVLLSIRPQWCAKIANGEKTIEVRKTRPKMETPFKCYIYCTAPKKFYTISEHMVTSMEYLHLCDGKVTMSDGFEFFGRADYKVLNRKVIGEFVCDKMYGIYYSIYPHDPPVFEEIGTLNRPNVMAETCLSEIELNDYLDGETGYGWHISALQIYGKPMELSEFHKPEMPTGLRYEDDTIKRPPQSWAYVEEYDGKR
jgi:predicted transcriptional regulator